jgi:hypothetical protein
MLVGLNLVFYNNSPSGKQRNLSAERKWKTKKLERRAQLDRIAKDRTIIIAILTKSMIGLKSTIIQKYGQH